MQSLFSLDWYSPVKRLTKWTTKRASRSLERRVLQLEERPVLLDGRPRGGVVREAPGDEAVGGAAAEGVQGGQGGVHPGLGHAKAGVDERARHGEVWGEESDNLLWIGARNKVLSEQQTECIK